MFGKYWGLENLVQGTKDKNIRSGRFQAEAGLFQAGRVLDLGEDIGNVRGRLEGEPLAKNKVIALCVVIVEVLECLCTSTGLVSRESLQSHDENQSSGSRLTKMGTCDSSLICVRHCVRFETGPVACLGRRAEGAISRRIMGRCYRSGHPHVPHTVAHVYSRIWGSP